MSAISVECYARFKYLADALPERFQPAVAEAQAALPSLLDGGYPVVLTHADLNEMNILINSNTGEITGIIDWSSASIQPFGFSLYALEDALGDMRADGWKWYDNADELRAAFWKAFKERTGLSEPQQRLAQLAAKAGILTRYGIAYDAGFSGPIGTEDFRYLDALL
ncbi:hypothetical protein KVR01_008832 [Diaporthe batatas]|uniref:uncharacterized protein n=1 Tax=Diaporthe batatas TaxID=748121 RepID=UPI001D041A10|nr:uncharacterized protein KVR01_008832 [Diaporthe batatas]KAG8161845.1 hypothetical protein KVR01_008832 [Diaporthe batatas]